MSEACRTLQTPVIGGNVSMYNERSGEAVYPTPTVGMVGLVHDLNHVTTQEFKQAGDLVYVIERRKLSLVEVNYRKCFTAKFSANHQVSI